MKRFLALQILIVVLLAVTLVGSTFAWSNRPNVNGGFMKTPFTFTYNDGKVNGNACTGTTYLGETVTDGKLTYSETELQSSYTVTVAKGETLYFRTAVKNSDTVATNVSLIAHIPKVDALNGKFNVGVSSPTKSVLAYPDEEFIPVVSQYEIAGDTEKTTYIDWYIKFNAAGQFTLEKVYLANN